VRWGYLAALASRTLGAAPLLSPATPSRFEPAGPGGGSFAVVVQPEGRPGPDGREGAGAPGPGVAGPRAPRAAGWDALGSPGEPPAPAPRSPAAPGAWDLRELRDLAAGSPSPDHAPLPGTPLPPEAPLPPPPALPRPPGATTPAVQCPAGAKQEAVGPAPAAALAAWPAVEVRRLGGDEPLGGPRASPGTQPAPQPQEPRIVVRIGRVEVRAVHPAPLAAPPPRPRPPSGPSLAEHLAARDRGAR
jgi:hypothetical protein